MYKILAIAALAAGCATPYQHRGATGGFSETQLDEHVFQIRFNGNAYTSGERASDFTLLRSAEVARQHGYHYFVIVEHKAGYSNSTYKTPKTTTTTGSATTTGNTTYGSATSTTTGGQTYVYAKPGTLNTIVCFVEKPEVPGMIYNADFVFKSLTEKYGFTGR
jgi:hypothetical protein